MPAQLQSSLRAKAQQAYITLILMDHQWLRGPSGKAQHSFPQGHGFDSSLCNTFCSLSSGLQFHQLVEFEKRGAVQALGIPHICGKIM